MSIKLNNPTFIAFIDNVNSSVVNHINMKNYFGMSVENKISTQQNTMKLIKSSINLRAKITDDELKSFITILWKKNEEMEIYELAQILFDISKNFDSVNDSTKPNKRQPKVIKTGKKINED